jgi:hypothetical protein
MTKTQYRAARRLLRDNGRYALRWLDENTRAAFERLEHGKDRLAERADIVAYCSRQGIACNVRHTA